MALKLITDATVLAVSLVEAKAHLRVDVADDDALITSMIWAAMQAAEQRTGLTLLPQTWEISMDAFPDAFELTRVPAVSIASLIYVDTLGASITLSNTLYGMDSSDGFGPAYVVPVYAGTWPDTRAEINAVRLRYVAGYANAASVPESIKSWIKLQVGSMYVNREAEGRQVYPLGFVDSLLDRYRVWS